MKETTYQSEVTKKYMIPHNDPRMISEIMLCMP